MREWLRICDDPQRHECHPTLRGQLPTRVLEVFSVHDPEVLRLHVSAPNETGRYLALSHRWGVPSENRRFCTLRSNYDQFRDHVSFDQLPKTFQDAITVTRSLEIPFLWIDSLCIIQDDLEDWEAQSKLMEDVFNFSYCTIAATCAQGTTDGFLKPRALRDFVTLKHKSGDVFYVCKTIDNFGVDVEEGELSQRGWVLQERALSHRTIHFTETQVYWECGDGIHCETLNKMRNLKSAILGDSEFPKSAERLVKGGRIELFQFLYRRYSRLAFTNKTDRSIAISGLEERLFRTFNTRGAYGVFDAFLNRSLLWQRNGAEMRRISYPRWRNAPSWSWMAYDGWITYVDIPFGGVDWFDSLESPFRQNPVSNTGNANDGGETSPIELAAIARDFSRALPRRPMEFVVFDRPDTEHHPEFKCVVIGQDMPLDVSAVQKYYILVVTPASSGGATRTYERVGAGFVGKHELDLEGPKYEIRIR
ncbi:hypothetical protein H2200_000155 [Cladophialophora chaetospira]|uniref:Heterokaryon incompatibility domain-containing protein n=1 Tax=Cladophialophora chaetospira TaxID=386627 RepID=A0AA39CQ20_9EURO|nr:hypothetical protein H2200_000155 [Cladophialophora chaetospira]